MLQQVTGRPAVSAWVLRSTAVRSPTLGHADRSAGGGVCLSSSGRSFRCAPQRCSARRTGRAAAEWWVFLFAFAPLRSARSSENRSFRKKRHSLPPHRQTLPYKHRTATPALLVLRLLLSLPTDATGKNTLPHTAKRRLTSTGPLRLALVRSLAALRTDPPGAPAQASLLQLKPVFGGRVLGYLEYKIFCQTSSLLLYEGTPPTFRPSTLPNTPAASGGA